MAKSRNNAGTGIRERLAEYNIELMRLTEMLDVAFAKGARSSTAPEDRVVFPLLVSCRDIVEEILFAVNDGFGRAALRSARAMYECVVIARYLNLHPGKTADFLSVFHTQWAKIVQSILAEYTSSAMHNSIAEHVPKYAAGRMVGVRDLDWSGKHVLAMARESGQLANLHSLAFDYTSAYVHPGAMFLLGTLSLDESTNNLVHVSVKPQDEEAKLALLIAYDLALNAADLRIRYSPSQVLQERFDECKEDFLRIWGFAPHL